MQRTSLVLLLSTVSIVSLSAHSVQARRQLVPDQPSVEVRMDALRALRQSTVAPAVPAYNPQADARQPVQPQIPEQIPFGAPTPPPVRQAQPAPVQPQYAPVPQRPSPVVAAPKPQPAPVIKEVIPEPPMVAKAPEKPKEQPKKLAKPAPEPVIAKQEPEKKIAKPKPVPEPKIAAPKPEPKVAPKPVAPVPTMDFDNFDDLPPLEIVEENVSGGQTQEFTLDDVAPEPPVAKAPEPKEQVKVAKKEQTPPPPPAALPEPDLEDLDFESFGAEEPELPELTLPKAEEKKEPVKVAEKVEKEAPKPEPLPELSLPEVDETKNDVKQASTTVEENVEDAVNLDDIEQELAALDDGMPELPSLDTLPAEPQVSEAPPVIENLPEPSLAPPAVPDTAPPVVTAPEPPKPAIAKLPPKKEEGLLPSIKSSIRSFLGGDEKTATPPPVGLPPLPEVKEAAKKQPPVAGLPPLPSDGQKPPSLPELPTDSATSENAGLPPLPDFGNVSEDEQSLTSDNSLPPLPSFNNEQQDDVDVFETASNESGLPPLPGLPMPETARTQESINSIVPDDVVENDLASLDSEPLPSLDSLDIMSGNNQNADLTVLFSQSETEVPLSYQQPLINLSKDLIANANSKIKVIAYASASDDQSSIAKRISLARALAVRAFLIDLGVDNVRISVQALGNEATSGATERADVIVIDN